MFERFSDRARTVVVLAQEEARMLQHASIGTEHLLLGVLHEGQGVGAKALTQAGVSLESARERVVLIVGEGTEPPPGHIPFTPRAKDVLELSLRESLALRSGYIGTEHVLLGLLREGEGVAAQVLQQLGVGLEALRETVMELVASESEMTVEVETPRGVRRGFRRRWRRPPPQSFQEEEEEVAPGPPSVIVLERLSVATWRVLGDAAALAADLGAAEIETHHLLLAAARHIDTGLDPAALREGVEDLDGRGPGSPDGAVPLSVRGRRALEGAATSAEVVEPLSLVLVLLDTPRSFAVRLLDYLEVDILGLIARLREGQQG